MAQTLPENLERVGPFIVESVLGRGSGGTVYRARHSQTGRVAAVKAVGPISGPTRRLLRREIEELCRFNHPGVVRILEHDMGADPPYYAMDLVEGLTLSQWAAGNLPRAPAPLLSSDVQAIGRIVGSLSATLAHLHAEGLVHRDLNPENILIRQNGEPILVDFGLATRFPGAINREALPVDVDPAGRIGYMAPEVIRGELVDARADLYSLGCILFELLTGAGPFVGSVREILDGHMHRAPAPLSAARAGIPSPLAELTLTLLEKAPDARRAYAADIAPRLLEHAAKMTMVGELGQRPLLYRARMVGREADLGWCEELLARASEGQGGIAAVGGESGIGKTRLLMEVSHKALGRGFAVFAGTCETLAGQHGGPGLGVALAGLRGSLAALADRCQEWGLAESERVLGPRGKILSAFEVSLASAPGQDAYGEPPLVAADGNRQRILDALTETWLAASRSGPVLVLVEDLQWADDLTLSWLEFVSKSGAFDRSRVLIIGSFRDDEVETPLSNLVTSDNMKCRHLVSISGGHLLNLVGEMLGAETVDGTFGAELVTAAGGNPLFVTEYLQLALAEGTVQRGARGWIEQLEVIPTPKAVSWSDVPRSVREVVQRRVARLSAPARRIAELAAVLGSYVQLALLREAAGDDAPAVQGAVSELQHRRVLTSGDTSAGLKFAHDKLREVLYEEMSAERRRHLHKLVGRALEKSLEPSDLVQGQGLQPYAVMAQHFLVAEERDKALVYFDKAADVAVGLYSNREASFYLRHLLNLDAGHPEWAIRRARWLRLLGTAENALGEIDASRESFARALTLLGHPFPGSRARLVSRLMVETARYLGGRATRAFRSGPATESAAGRAHEALLGHQGIGYLLSDGLGVLYNCTKMLNLAHSSGTSPALVRAAATMGLALGLAPLRSAAEYFFSVSHRAARAGGDAESEAWALLVEGYYRLGRGELAASRSALETAYALSVRTRDLRRGDECRVLLAEVAILAWDRDRALTLSEEALASGRTRADRQTQLWALTIRARIALQTADPKDALRALTQAEAFVQKTVPADRIMLEGLFAFTHLKLGNVQNGLKHARRAAHLLRGEDSAVYYTIHGCWTAAETLLHAAHGRFASSEPDVLALAMRCLKALRRHARRYPVAWPRYWLAEGSRRQALGLGSATKAFHQAGSLALTLGLPQEASLARTAAGT